VVGVISLHSTDKAGPETWEVKRADGVRDGFSRDRVGTHQPRAKINKVKYDKKQRRVIMYLHIEYKNGNKGMLDMSRDSSWRQTKLLNEWRSQKHIKTAYLSMSTVPNPSC
tara:strand:+ start:1870 stop:2202 length:333 start_codon:yes stop_codon:yes gene_type:complete